MPTPTGSERMRRDIHLGALALALVLSSIPAPLRVEAQAPAKVPRIGFLSSRSLTALASQLEAFRQGLRELGYVEGQNS